MSSAADLPEPKPWTAPPGRVRWRGLLLPHLVIIALLAGYSIFWLFGRAKLEVALDSTAEALRAQGYGVELVGRRIGGFPFRLKLSYERASILAPSGWGLSIPGLEAQAYLHAPFHWVLVAPHGLTIGRPSDGPVATSGLAIRASVAGVQATPWRVTLEGVNLAFTPGPGAKPFAFTRADRFDVLLRPAPDHSGGQLLVRLTDATPSRDSLLGAMVGSGSLTADLALRITRPERFDGPTWSAAARAWTRAGGQLQIVRLQAQTQAMSATASPAALVAGADGRLSGSVPLGVRSKAAGRTSPLRLDFRDGRTWLGPADLGGAPRLFGP